MYESLKCPSCGEMIQFQPVKMDGKAQDGSMPMAKDVSVEDAKTMPLDKLREKLPKKSEE